ncbi:MAG: translation initiation factor IF-2 [Bacilli bacterium]|nr:translation initiation factor IF-2 [Bacilli bacterium]
MMSVLEYALEVKKSAMDILTECKKLGIDVSRQEDILDEEAIIMLDSVFAALTQEEDVFEDSDDEFVSGDEDLTMAPPKQPKKTKAKKVSSEDNFTYAKERKKMYKRKDKLTTNISPELDDDVVLYHDQMTVTDLATALNISPAEFLKKLISLGIMVNINSVISYENAEIIILEYNKILKRAETQDESNFEAFEDNDDEKSLVERPPVVTIMGHVDHGKTTLLDTIRKTKVALGEAGGITQHIGAYQVSYQGKKITFIDTPGHEAFTEMRARGASVTDIVIIIVAVDDGVMPQTKEAIDHAKAAGAPIIVAINKMDKQGANIERILKDLADCGIMPEEWGGETLISKISAARGDGINELLDNILLISEMLELKANPHRYARGTVIESRLDKKVGVVTTLLIQNGTLRLGDPIVVGTTYGKVRTLINDLNQPIVEAPPSLPVEIIGLNDVPVAGDKFMAFESEKKARTIAEMRQRKLATLSKKGTALSLDDLFKKIQDGIKEINVILKADMRGSEEAIKQALVEIDVEGIKVNVIRSSVGNISESDIVLANASEAIIIGFNVRPSAKTQEVAKEYNVDIRLHTVIYKIIEEMTLAMKGMLDPEYEENILGQAEIRKIFKFSKVGNIAGCYINSGIIKKGAKARVIRDGMVIFDGDISTIQREKDAVKEVKQGFECGITIDKCHDMKEKDIIEAYEMVAIKR